MTGRVRVIRSRWWAVLLRAIGLVCFLFLLIALWFAVFRDFGASSLGGGLFLMAFGAFNLFGGLLMLSTLRLRVEVGSEGFRVVSLFGGRDFYWREIEDFRPASNYRLPGFHVEFRVDGTINSRRSGRGLGLPRHYIPPGLEMGGIKLSRYLSKRWRAWQRRQEGPIEDTVTR